jgi:DNA-binding NarL/FixJ family response regulator
MSPKVLIVEDEPLVAEDLAMLLKKEGYTIAGIAHTGSRALDYLHNQKPDLALLDIALNAPLSGFSIAETINEKYQIPFIFITAFSDRHTLDRAKNLYPSGYIVKPFKKKDVLVNVELALHHSQRKSTSPFLELKEINENHTSHISPKEYEIILDIVNGLSNQELADKHSISLNTVKTHLKRIFTKLDLSSRSQLAKIVIRST